MRIDWIDFTPWTSLLGGMLIGLAAALLILLNGRISGISGGLSPRSIVATCTFVATGFATVFLLRHVLS